jgi:hypothetical protein
MAIRTSKKHFITKSGNRPNNYVSNKELYVAIQEYHKDMRRAKREGQPRPRIPEFIGKCIYQIAENLSMSPSFINYSFREEMVSDGYLNSIEYFHNFNPRKYKNPFAYFTQVMIFAFIRRIKKEEKSRYAICNSFQHTILHGDLRGLDQINYNEQSTGDDGNYLITKKMYDNLNDFMYKFEEKETKQKEKRIEVKKLKIAAEKKANKKRA